MTGFASIASDTEDDEAASQRETLSYEARAAAADVALWPGHATLYGETLSLALRTLKRIQRRKSLLFLVIPRCKQCERDTLLRPPGPCS